jgi:hypothetical protein
MAEVVRMVEVANEVSAVVVATDPVAADDCEMGRQGPALAPMARAITPVMKLVKIIVKNVVISKIS